MARAPLWAPPNFAAKSTGGSPIVTRGLPVAISSDAASSSSALSTTAGRSSKGAGSTTRKDAPKVRRVVRGTLADAIAAMASDGQAALVEALLADRFARTATATRQCLINT